VEVAGDGETSLVVLEERARSYEAESKSANTWRAYIRACGSRDGSAEPV
jgi:hypothetical protein